MQTGNLQPILFCPSSLAVEPDNFGLNCFFLQKERASHSGHLSSLACNNLVLCGKRWCRIMPCKEARQRRFCKDGFVQDGMVSSHCHVSPAARTACLQTDRQTTGRSGSSAFEGRVALSNTLSCKSYPTCDGRSNSRRLKSVCDERLGFRGGKLQCKNHSVLLPWGQRDTDQCPQRSGARDLQNDPLAWGMSREKSSSL